MRPVQAELKICDQVIFRKVPSLRIHPTVRAALDSNQPVVALESTIIAHGMPYPENLQTAKALEKSIRSNGATPATVAVISGIPHVGLSHDQLHLLATHPSIRKLSRRDLPTALADAAHGATTVSATMFLSSLAGIPVFATGGIGGVHRGVAATFDISSDLHALASIRQLVVCAGAKSILDIPKTLEALETASVPVLVLAHDQFPAFYTRDSGKPAPRRVESELEAAKIVNIAHSMRAANGVLLAVPVPEHFEADAELVQRATVKALREMKTSTLKPSEVTPFLLKRIAEITDGASLRTNMHLARNNACVAARVAVRLSRLRKTPSDDGTTAQIETKPSAPSDVSSLQSLEADVLVVGGTALDIHCGVMNVPVMGSSNIGRIRQCAGGVGKNVAEAATVLGNVSVNFISCVGDDVAGRAVLAGLQESGLRTAWVKRYPGKRTGVCCVVHDTSGDLTVCYEQVAVADFEEMFNGSSSFIEEVKEDIICGLKSAKVVCMDANFAPGDMRRLVNMCKQHDVPIWFEPTTSIKCKRVVEADVIDSITYMSPNEGELKSIACEIQARSARYGMDDEDVDASCEKKFSVDNGVIGDTSRTEDDELLHCARLVLQYGKGLRILCTRGARGVRRFFRLESGEIQVDDFRAMQLSGDILRNTTGAGDCFAGRCVAGIAVGEDEDEAIRRGIAAAGHCCMSEEIVPRSVFPTKL